MLELLLIVSSVGLIAAGAFAAVTSANGTYIDLGARGIYRTDQYGLATERTNWSTQLFGWAGSVRLKVTSESKKPIFVGVAAPEVIEHYISGVGYTSIGEDDARIDQSGAAPAIPPASAVKWTAYAEGVGTQTLRWDATDEPQVAFAMNADGSRPVHVRIVSSAVTLDRMPWWVPAGSLALGILLLVIGVMTIRRSTRARNVTG
jgi:hypothetical protein